MQQEDLGQAADARHRRNVADEIVSKLLIKCRIDRIHRAGQEQRVSVSGRAHHGLCADVASGARSILGNEWLPKPLRQPLPHEAREDVGAASRRERNDYPYRPRRIGLRQRQARSDRERGSACRR